MSNLNPDQIAAVVAQAVAGAMVAASDQNDINQYLEEESPEIVQAKQDKLVNVKQRATDRAQALFNQLDDLNPYTISSVAYGLYYSARRSYFRSRQQWESTAVSYARQQDQGVKTGQEYAETYNAEEPMNQMNTSEWWLGRHAESMDENEELAYTGQALLELANVAVRNDLGREANNFIEVDLTDKAFAQYDSNNPQQFRGQVQENRQKAIAALRIQRDTSDNRQASSPLTDDVV